MAASNSEPPIFVGPIEESFLKDYSLVEFIGSGSYGGVYRAKHKSSNELTAVKIIYPQDNLSEDEDQGEEYARTKMRREFLLVFGKKHRNIVNVHSALETKLDEKNLDLLLKPVKNAAHRGAKLVKAKFEYFATESRCALLIKMELCEMTLRQWIETRQGKHPYIVNYAQTNIILELVEGLKFLHGNNILHRDLKSENIFYTHDRVKIGDFGLCRIVHSDNSRTSDHTIKPATTPLYKAPELNTQEYALQADLFSLGLLIVEVLRMLKARRRRAEFAKVRRGEFRLSTVPFKNAKLVVAKLTERNVQMRYKSLSEIDLEVCDHVKFLRKLSLPNVFSDSMSTSTTPQAEEEVALWFGGRTDVMDIKTRKRSSRYLDDATDFHDTKYRAIANVSSYSAGSGYLNFKIGDIIRAEKINGKWITGRNVSTWHWGKVHLNHVQRLGKTGASKSLDSRIMLSNIFHNLGDTTLKSKYLNYLRGK